MKYAKIASDNEPPAMGNTMCPPDVIFSSAVGSCPQFFRPMGIFMKTAALLVLVGSLLISGCASVNMAPKEESAKAKEFNPPSQGSSGVYIYRNSFVGKALKKDVWIDGKCIGESAPDVFFYTEVEGGKKHKLDTESEFSPNTLEVMFEAGKNYFIRQFIKMGVFVGGAGLEQIPEEQGKSDVAKLEMAQAGTCSTAK